MHGLRNKGSSIPCPDLAGKSSRMLRAHRNIHGDTNIELQTGICSQIQYSDIQS